MDIATATGFLEGGELRVSCIFFAASLFSNTKADLKTTSSKTTFCVADELAIIIAMYPAPGKTIDPESRLVIQYKCRITYLEHSDQLNNLQYPVVTG